MTATLHSQCSAVRTIAVSTAAFIAQTGTALSSIRDTASRRGKIAMSIAAMHVVAASIHVGLEAAGFGYISTRVFAAVLGVSSAAFGNIRTRIALESALAMT